MLDRKVGIGDDEAEVFDEEDDGGAGERGEVGVAAVDGGDGVGADGETVGGDGSLAANDVGGAEGDEPVEKRDGADGMPQVTRPTR